MTEHSCRDNYALGDNYDRCSNQSFVSKETVAATADRALLPAHPTI